MQKIVLTAVGGYALINAGYIWAATQHWYDTVPGVAATGPLNSHFALDVGLAFLASGLALIWSAAKSDTTAAVVGVGWLVFHALFHLWIWLHRGMPADLVALTNLSGIQLPAWLAAWATLKLRNVEMTQ